MLNVKELLVFLIQDICLYVQENLLSKLVTSICVKGVKSYRRPWLERTLKVKSWTDA